MSRLFKSVLVFFFVLFLSGCVHQELILPSFGGYSSSTQKKQSSVDVSDINTKVQSSSVVQRIPFPQQEYSRLARSGSATVSGTVYVIAPSGEKVVGKQTRLYLNPVTSYSRQWYEQSYLGGHKMDKADPRLYNYLRFTTSDNQGRFSFYGVPPGRYYLIGVVSCSQECGYGSAKKIRIAKEISVGNSGTVNVELSKQI